jgi:hypothetical protein
LWKHTENSMHSVSCLISAINTQHVEVGRVKGRRRKEELEEVESQETQTATRCRGLRFDAMLRK